MLRILTVAHYCAPHVGGLEIAVHNVQQSLVKEGHDVTHITCAHSGMRNGTSIENGVTIHRVRALNFFDTRFGIPFPIPSPAAFFLMWREVGKVDLVHINDCLYPTSWIAYGAARLRGKPLFLTQHVALVEHPNPFVMALQRAVYAIWGRLIYRYASRIIAYNAVVKNFAAERAAKNKIVEIPNGINLTLFHPVESLKEKTALRKEFNLPATKLALFVGRFVPKKGIDILFSARDEKYDLVFVGSGEAKHSWKQASNVHVLGALSQESLAKLYRAADVCVLPSRGELFTLALQEAAASGLPIITTRERAYAAYDLDRDGISLIDPTPSNIKKAIQSVLSDKNKRKRMSEYSLKLAQERFDREKNSESLLTIFRAFESKRFLVTTSWDDGHVLDLQLARLLKKYGLQGTFYVSPMNRELKPEERLQREQLTELSSFEIGAHTLTHLYLPSINAEVAAQEIVSSKAIIEDWTGKTVTSFCYPKGGYAPAHKSLVEKASYKLARTTKRFALHSDDAYALPTTIHAYDHWSDIWNLLVFVRFNPVKFWKLYHRWDLQAIALFDEMLKRGGVFHLWGHSWEIDQNKDWQRLEKVLQYISNKHGVRYVSNEGVLAQ